MQNVVLDSCRRARSKPRRRQRGMALVETLVSILMFSFGVLGLMALEARAINFSVDAEDRNRAALFANEIVSEMWLANSVTVPATTFATWQTNVANTTSTGVPNGTVAITPVAGTTNAADILITWKPPSDNAAAITTSLTTRVILP